MEIPMRVILAQGPCMDMSALPNFRTPPWECGIFRFHFHTTLARLLRTNFIGNSSLEFFWA